MNLSCRQRELAEWREKFFAALGCRDVELIDRVAARLPPGTDWSVFVAAVRAETRAKHRAEISGLDDRFRRLRLAVARSSLRRVH